MRSASDVDEQTDALFEIDPDHQQPCTHSAHPNHAHWVCGNRAEWLIVALCAKCSPRPRPLCALHLVAYLPNYLHDGPWCSCVTEHSQPGHRIIDVQVVPL